MAIVVMISLDVWSPSFRKRPFHFAAELRKRGWTVFYVQALPYRERLRTASRGVIYTTRELREAVVVNVNVPLPQRAGRATYAFQTVNSHLVTRILARLVRETGERMSNVRVVANNPFLFSAKQVSRLGVSSVVYDCLDDYPSLVGGGKTGNAVRAIEQEIISCKDVKIAAVSQSLVRRFATEGVTATYLPNGVDYDMFAKSVARARPDAEKVIAGYVGTISWWFDFEFIDRLIEADPRYKVILYGVVDRRVDPVLKSRLRAWKGRVSYNGFIPYERLPEILSNWHLALIPFKPSPLVEGVNPIKIYEYFAVGLPVLSSYWPELDQFYPYVQFYNGPLKCSDLHWSSMKHAIVGENFLRARRAIAAANSWSKRVDQLISLLC